MTSIASACGGCDGSGAGAHRVLWEHRRCCGGKCQLIRALPNDGVAVLNADDGRVRAMRSVVRGALVTVGYDRSADVFVEDVQLSVHYDGAFLEGQRVSELVVHIARGR